VLCETLGGEISRDTELGIPPQVSICENQAITSPVSTSGIAAHSPQLAADGTPRRSPRSKEARVPYYLPLSQQPLHISGSPKSTRCVSADFCVASPAAAHTPSAKRGQDRPQQSPAAEVAHRVNAAPATSYEYPTRSHGAASALHATFERHTAAELRDVEDRPVTRSGRAAGNKASDVPPAAACEQQRQRGPGIRGKELVIHLDGSPTEHASVQRSNARQRRGARSVTDAQPSCSADQGGSAMSGREGGRVRRATAAAALLRLQGKMKPPASSALYNNLLPQQARAAVSAAVSAVHAQSAAASEALTQSTAGGKGRKRARRDFQSCATSGAVQHRATAGAQRAKAGGRAEAAARGAGAEDAQKQSVSPEGPQKRARKAVRAASAPAEPAGTCAERSGDSQGHRATSAAAGNAKQGAPSCSGRSQGRGGPGRAGGDAQGRSTAQQPEASSRSVAARGRAARRAGRSAGALVAAVAARATTGAPAALPPPPPPRGRAAAQAKQQHARAAAARGRMAPAAVPPRAHPSPEPASPAADGPATADAPAPMVGAEFASGSAPWTDAEVRRLRHVCTSKVPPTALRYWQQVALHMPGAQRPSSPACFRSPCGAALHLPCTCPALAMPGPPCGAPLCGLLPTMWVGLQAAQLSSATRSSTSSKQAPGRGRGRSRHGSR
jgi:hypothetical protein